MTIRLNDQKSITPEIPAFLRKDPEPWLPTEEAKEIGELRERLRIITLLDAIPMWESTRQNIKRAILGVE